MSTASADPPERLAPADRAPSGAMPAADTGGGQGRGGHARGGIVLAGIGDEAAADLPGQLAALHALGWRHLEVRTIDGVPIAALDDAAFARAVEQIRAADLTVVAVASKIGDWSRPITGDFSADLDELRVLARRCAALGTRLVRVMSYPSGGLAEPEWGRRARARLRDLARHAEDAGLVLAHENCTGWAGDRAARMLDLLTAVDSPALRLLFDTGNGVPYGYPSRPMLAAVLEHVVHVHVKDAVITPDGQVGYVPPGTGEADVAGCLRLLYAHGYTGALSLEPHIRLRPHLAATGRSDSRRRRAGGPHPPWSASPGTAAPSPDRPGEQCGTAGAGTTDAAPVRPVANPGREPRLAAEQEPAARVLTADRPEDRGPAGQVVAPVPRPAPGGGGEAAEGLPYHEGFVTCGRALERLLTRLGLSPPVAQPVTR